MMLTAIKSKSSVRKRYLYKNIEFLLKAFNIDTKTLAMQTGVPAPTIVRLKKEENNPTLSSLEPISQFFRVEMHDLLYEDLSSERYQQKRNLGSMQCLKAYNLADIKNWPHKVSDNVFVAAVANLHRGAFALNVGVSSLEPVFCKNSVILLDPKVDPKDGDYVFVQLNNDSVPVIRRLLLDGKSHYFNPVNPSYGQPVHTKKFNIIGVVIKSIENFR